MKMNNELNYSDTNIYAILGHEKTTSLGHYLHVSFDSMTEPIQQYADWLCGLTVQPVRPATHGKGENQQPLLVSARPAVPIPVAPPLSRPVIVPFLDDEEDKQRLHSLSGRERDVLAWFAHGQSYTGIAARLRLSIQAVNSHRAGLLRKLHLSSTAGLIRYAIAHKADRLLPIPAQPTPPPVIAPPVVVPMVSTAEPIVRASRSIEREEWPG